MSRIPFDFIVAEPTPNHEHWGLKLIHPSRGNHELEGPEDGECHELEAYVFECGKGLGLFHQGGSHGYDECGGYHYFEAWSLPQTAADGREQIMKLIEDVKARWQYTHHKAYAPGLILKLRDFDHGGKPRTNAR